MKTRVTLLFIVLGYGVLTGCETGGQSGALIGAGIGALAGQAIGGDTTATLIGTGVGTGVGYIIGNEVDKKHAREIDHYDRPHTLHSEVGTLGGTRWEIISMAPSDYYPAYSSKVIEFRTDGRAVTTTTMPDGSVEVDSERYRVVGKTLILNESDYLINAEFGIEDDEMVIDAEQFRAVLRRLYP